MIIYSVTVNVDEEVVTDWIEWMAGEHIPDVMATACFDRFHFHELLEPAPEEGSRTFNIQYECKTIEHYRTYTEHFAPALQGQHFDRYGHKCVAFRTLLQRLTS